jgi:hypothetical protein
VISKGPSLFDVRFDIISRYFYSGKALVTASNLEGTDIIEVLPKETHPELYL